MASSTLASSSRKVLQRFPSILRRRNVAEQFWKGATAAHTTSSHPNLQRQWSSAASWNNSQSLLATIQNQPASGLKISVIRSFSTGGSGSGDGGDNNETASSPPPPPPSPIDSSSSDQDISSSPIESTEYNPEEVMKTFQDTSYYYQPIHDDVSTTSTKFSNMTNEELMDNSTIPGWDYLIHSPPIDKAAIPKGALVGTVASTKMQKTVNVAVDRYKIHHKYRKRIRYTRKFMAHDEEEVARDGDTVLIVPCQRISKHKHFMMREIVRAKGQL